MSDEESFKVGIATVELLNPETCSPTPPTYKRKAVTYCCVSLIPIPLGREGHMNENK